MDPIRVLVVDDYEPFRRLIRSLLEKSHLRIIGEASDGLEAVQKAALLQPDLILLDIALPKLNGIRAAEQMRDIAPNSKILFLAQDNSRDVDRSGFQIGGDRLPSKNSSSPGLHDRDRGCACGEAIH